MTNKTFPDSFSFPDSGAVRQADRHVERPLQPQPLRHLPGHRHDIQPGPQ